MEVVDFPSNEERSAENKEVLDGGVTEDGSDNLALRRRLLVEMVVFSRVNAALKPSCFPVEEEFKELVGNENGSGEEDEENEDVF